MMRKIILMAVLLSLIGSSAVSAANLTHIIPAGDTVVVNQTTIFPQGPPNYHTPFILFLLMVAIGIGGFLLSLLLKPETPFDMVGYLAPVALLISTIMSTGIDIRTSAAVSSAVIGGSSTMTIIENHTIYFDWLLSLFLFIVFLISIVNVMRIRAKMVEDVIKSPE
jgi:hypothetical protein